ncbi:hypothetical protein [Hydrogenophaga sp. OTU3427]|uniref:hypothetical protein n=1 Tax=Hydrogenophaga sp. OTU3427 TaxID=3043856 RepID=UPI00313AE193
MQAHYAERFERDMACTEAEWLRWLPQAMGAHPWQRQGASLRADIDQGQLAIDWQVVTPRAIALMRLPRLVVAFHFSGLDDAQRHRFMKRFDLYMLRGGG